MAPPKKRSRVKKKKRLPKDLKKIDPDESFFGCFHVDDEWETPTAQPPTSAEASGSSQGNIQNAANYSIPYAASESSTDGTSETDAAADHTVTPPSMGLQRVNPPRHVGDNTWSPYHQMSFTAQAHQQSGPMQSRPIQGSQAMSMPSSWNGFQAAPTHNQNTVTFQEPQVSDSFIADHSHAMYESSTLQWMTNNHFPDRSTRRRGQQGQSAVIPQQEEPDEAQNDDFFPPES